MDIIERVRPRICFFLCILKEEGQREKAIEYVNIYIIKYLNWSILTGQCMYYIIQFKANANEAH